MRKLKTSDITTSVAMPIKSGTLEHLQFAYQEAFSSIAKSIIYGTLYDAAVGYILHGCINSGTGSNYIISPGAIFFNGEIYQVPAATFTISGSNVAVGTITTTQFSAGNADPVNFTDGNAYYVHDIRQIVFDAGLSGSGDVNFVSCVDSRYKPQGCIGQTISWALPSGSLGDYFDGTGLGTHPLVLGWAITNGNNGTSNFAGRVMVGWKLGDSDFGTVGLGGGEKTHTLTGSEMPSHGHEIRTTLSVGNTSSSDPVRGSVSGDAVNPRGEEATPPTDDRTIGLSGGGLAHNNLQPFLTTLLIQRIA